MVPGPATSEPPGNLLTCNVRYRTLKILWIYPPPPHPQISPPGGSGTHSALDSSD